MMRLPDTWRVQTDAARSNSFAVKALRDGMRPLRLAGALRVAEGLTTLEEVLAATPPLELK